MSKVWRIVILGLVIWSLALLWPELNRLLTPMAMIGLIGSISVIGTMAILLAWMVERALRQRQLSRELSQQRRFIHARPTQPVLSTASLHAEPTRPMPRLTPSPASAPTRPVPVHNPSSRPTRPVAI